MPGRGSKRVCLLGRDYEPKGTREGANLVSGSLDSSRTSTSISSSVSVVATKENQPLCSLTRVGAPERPGQKEEAVSITTRLSQVVGLEPG